MTLQSTTTLLIRTYIIILFAWSSTSNAQNLSHIYQKAVQHDPELTSAKAELYMSIENVSEKEAGIRPKIDLSAEIARNREEVETNGIGTAGTSYFDSNNIELTLKQPLYNKSVFSKIDIAENKRKIAGIKYYEAQQDLIIRVTDAYLNALVALDKLDFDNAEKDVIDEQLENIEQRYKVGKSTETDLQEARATNDLAKIQVIIKEDEHQDALLALSQLTGDKHDSINPLSDDFTPITLESDELEYWLNEADSGNLALQSLRLQLQNFHHELSSQKAGHYPTLDLIAKYRLEETGGRFGESDTDDRSIALQFELPIYEGGKVSSRIRSMQMKANLTKQELEKEYRTIKRFTESTLRMLNTSSKRIQARKRAMNSSRDALSLTKKGYRHGTRTSADILDSQREFFKAEVNYKSDRYDQIRSYLRMLEITGRLEAKHIDELSQWFD